MSLRSRLLALTVAALLNITQATFGHSAPRYAWCADDPAMSVACYYGNGQWWVTETGLGVCVPGPPVSARHQGVFIEPRH